MKKFLGILLVLALLLGGSALAAEGTDVPGTPTQDAVVSLAAEWMDEAHAPYAMQVMPADPLTMDVITQIYSFVYEENNRPVRYFPEETQAQIEAMLSGQVDPDALYMTEFMRLYAPEANAQADLLADMQLDVGYEVGSVILVVLGDTSDPEKLVWTPVESEVTALGRVAFTVPQALMDALQGEDVLFSLLTVQQAGRGGIARFEQDDDTKPVELPSKTAYDTTRIVKMIAADGGSLEDAFELIVVEESETIKDELARIREWVKVRQQPLCSWLPEESQSEIQLLLGDGLAKEALVVYDYLPLITKNYKDAYGDVVSNFTFATPYRPGQQVVTVLGLPREGTVEEDETLMDWAVQRAQVKEDGGVEIVFDQLALIGMGQETGLLLVLCEPLAE